MRWVIVCVSLGLMMGCTKKEAEPKTAAPAPKAAESESTAPPVKATQPVKAPADLAATEESEPTEETVPKGEPAVAPKPETVAAEKVEEPAGSKPDQKLVPGDPAALKGTIAKLVGQAPEQSEDFKKTENALRQIAKTAKTERRAPSGTRSTVGYKALLGELNGKFGTPAGRQALLAAARFTTSDDPHERGAAYVLLDAGMMELARTKGETIDYERVLLEKLGVADSKERYDIARILANHPSAETGKTLAWLGQNADAARVRRAAFESLDACPTQVCSLSAQILKEWFEAEKEAEVRGAIVRIAGAYRSDLVLDTCAGKLASREMGPGCRTALVRLRNERAFTMLHAWLNSYKDEPGSFAPSADPIGQYVSLLAVFSNTSYGNKAYLDLIDSILGQDKRRPVSVASLVNQLGAASDKPAALKLAQKYQRVYTRRWKKPNKEQLKALLRFERAIKRLKG